MCRNLLCVVILLISSRCEAQDDKPASPPAGQPKVVRDQVRGSINHGSGKTEWRRVIGKARVIDACNVEFEDGTRIELDITVPEPGQMAMNGESLYPAGQEAAEFLRKLIGDRPLACFRAGGPWIGYVGDVNVEHAMIIGGWALADHSSLHAAEIIARENKRGLWRGKFVHPDDWRAGLRLPGEPEPGKIADEKEANALLHEFGRGAVLPVLVQRIVQDVPTVQRLNFANSSLTDRELAQLGRLKSLKRLTLGGDITNEGMEHLQGLTSLTDLHVSQSITAAGLARLKPLKGLKLLDLSWGKHTDESLAQLTNFTELENLNAIHTEITDAGLRHLTRMQKLRRLTLYHTNVGDTGLVHLVGLKSLAFLDLSQTRITDAGMVHLKALEKLVFLDVTGNGITDAGVMLLTGLKQLRVLNAGDRVTDEARRRLREALPDLKFEGRPEDVPENPGSKPATSQIPVESGVKTTGGTSAAKSLAAPESPGVVWEQSVRGGVEFPPEKRQWIRIRGKVEVLSPHLVKFADGTEADLHWNMRAPALEQQGRIGGSLYPAGREATEFLRKLIGDREVIVYVHPDLREGNKVRGGGYVGESNLEIEMIRNGWAFSDHEGMDIWEIMARENKRGMWRGEFISPARWRKGERLPGEEPAPAPEAEKNLSDEQLSRLVGRWDSLDRHVAMGSLFQPVHGVRKREAVVVFEKIGERLTGHAVVESHKAISYQERWKDGRTEFRNIRFANNRLTFDFPIAEWVKTAGPLAVESGTLENRGTIQIEARLTEDRLVGTWHIYTSKGAEVFRGEWEATRMTNDKPDTNRP